MTEVTSQKLADALRSAGFEDIAVRAEADEFHDYKSPHALPNMTLESILRGIMHGAKDEKTQMAAHNLRLRLIDGEFDASKEEGEAWAASPEGQAAFRALHEGE